MEYKTLFKAESFGSQAIGVHILVASNLQIDLTTDEFRAAAWAAGEAIQQELQAASIAVDSAAQDRAVRDRAALLALFPDPIFVETIPNGYCARACCRHLPWFIVTTKVGRFKLGWRKRVISIDWSETIVPLSADELFPQEDVTKSGRSIHAWGVGKARSYVAAVIAVGSAT